jgi:hypothetical protein
MGKHKEHGIRDELSLIRDGAISKDKESKKRKKILADIKALDYGDALGLFAREKHGSDIDATLNDPNLMEGLEEIATRKQELALDKKGTLLVKVAQLMKEVEAYDQIGDKADPNTKRLMDEKRKYIQSVYRALGSEYNLSPKEIDTTVGSINSSAGTSPTEGRPTPPSGFNPNTGTVTSTQPSTPPSNVSKAKDLLIKKKPTSTYNQKTGDISTGLSKVYEDGRGFVERKADEANQAIRDGSFLPKTRDNALNLTDTLFGEEQLPEGWAVENIELKQTGKKKKAGDPLNKRKVYFHNATGKYVGQRDGTNGDFDWFVGDVRNGVNKTFKSKEEAYEFANTYQPKVPKKIEKVKLDGTDSAGSYTHSGIPEEQGDMTVTEKFWRDKDQYVSDLQGFNPEVVSEDHRTPEQRNRWKPVPNSELDSPPTTWAEQYSGTSDMGDKPIVVPEASVKGYFDQFRNSEVINQLRGLFTSEETNDESPDVNGSNSGLNNAGGVSNTIPSGGKHSKNYGGFAGQNSVATSAEHFMTDPFVKAMVTAESNGKERAVGYKLTEAKDANGKTIMKANGQPKLVHAKKDGKKIPTSFGVMQITIGTALSTEAGKELMRGLDPRNEEDRKEIVEILFDPYNNLKIGTEYASRLRTQLEGNKYASKFNPIDFDKAVSAAYNYKGENFAKDVLDKYKPKSMKDLLHRAYIPAETRRQIRVVGRQLGKVGR